MWSQSGTTKGQLRREDQLLSYQRAPHCRLRVASLLQLPLPLLITCLDRVMDSRVSYESWEITTKLSIGRRCISRFHVDQFSKAFVNQLFTHLNYYVESQGENAELLYCFSILPALALQRTGASCHDRQQSDHLRCRLSL